MTLPKPHEFLDFEWLAPADLDWIVDLELESVAALSRQNESPLRFLILYGSLRDR